MSADTITKLNFASFMFPYQARTLKGFGESFKKQVRESAAGFRSVGEVWKSADSRDRRIE